MNKKYFFTGAMLLAACGLAGLHLWLPAGGAAVPADLRDAPNSAAYEELSSGSAAEAPAAPAAVQAAHHASERGSGKWTGWLQGRDDYGYLPGTRNVDSGSRGFKVYYRCSAFEKEADGGFSMSVQFANDKGGDLGLVTWTRGPSEKAIQTVKFEGRAWFGTGYGQPYQPQNPAAVLNAMRNYEGFCAEAYRAVEAHRPTIVKYLMKRDIKGMERLYAAAKFIPGPIGILADGMEISIALGQSEGFKAAEGAGCLITGLALERASHKLVRSELLKYLLEKSCSGAATAAGALHHGEEHSGPLYFTGVLKTTRPCTDYNGNRRVPYPEDAAAMVELAYIEREETVKNIFFDNWR